MSKTPETLIQPPWRQIAEETLRANDPERAEEMTEAQRTTFLDDLALTAEKTYAKIVERTKAKYGPVRAGKLSAIQEIVMADVIVGEIPRA